MAERKLLLFTGAGFSKAVHAGLPTTLELYKSIVEGGPSIPYSHYIESLLQTPIDIEVFARRIGRTIKALELLSRDGEGEAEHVRHNTGSYSLDEARTILQHKEALRASLENVNKRALKELNCRTLDNKASKLVADCKKLIVQLNENFTLKMYSTNYDNLIRYIHPEPEYYLDNNAVARKIVNVDKLINGNSNSVAYPYIPLKGMLDWTREGDKIIEGLDFGSAASTSVILPFEYIEEPTASPFNGFYNAFREDVRHAQYMAFIGFSFRDEFINELLKGYSGSCQKIVIVTKRQEDYAEWQKRVKRLFPRCEKSIIWEDEGFSGNSVLTAIN